MTRAPHRHSRLLLVLVWVCAIASAMCALPGVAPAADDGWVVVDGPTTRTSWAFARLTPAAAQRIALADPDMAQAHRMRPDAPVRVTWDRSRRHWRVYVRERGIDLATVVVSDVTGRVVSRDVLPLGEYPSKLTERTAIDAAVADRRVRQRAKHWDGIRVLRARGHLNDGTWEIDLLRPHHLDEDPVIRVDVDDTSGTVTGVWTGIQVKWTMARGNRRAFGGDVNDSLVWYPFVAVFLLVMLDWRRLLSLHNSDVLALVSLCVSHEFFLQGRIGASTPLAVPPLVYLLWRMIDVWRRGVVIRHRPLRTPRALTSLASRRVPTWMIVAACVLIAGVRTGIIAEGGNVIDVGYAGVAGARALQHNRAPWGHMPTDNPHGDTYGPLNYVAYLPAVVLVDRPHDPWGEPMPAAVWTSVVADLACAALLVLIGWRWWTARAGWLLALGWITCPWTTWATASSVNDELVALALLGAVALIARPVARGALVGVAAMVKFAPVAAFVALMHVGRAARLRQTLRTSVAMAVVCAASIAWALHLIGGSPTHAASVFWQHTVGYQVGRDSPFSVWGLYGWRWPQRVCELAVVALLAWMALRPPVRNPVQACAGVTAALIAVQLTVSHWFWLYVPWFVGTLLIVVMAHRLAPTLPARLAHHD